MKREILWKRGARDIRYGDLLIQAPAPLMWAAEISEDGQLGMVTLFDEDTPTNQTNAFVYDARKHSFQRLELVEDGRCVRLLGCYAEENYAVFNAANETEYLIDPATCRLLSSRYYR